MNTRPINYETLIDDARDHLYQMKMYEPRVTSFTLYITEPYGFRTLKVFLDPSRKSRLLDKQRIRTNDDIDDSLIEYTELPEQT